MRPSSVAAPVAVTTALAVPDAAVVPMRQFALPLDVETAKLEAEFKDGVLNVHLPKAVVAKPKAIEVKVA